MSRKAKRYKADQRRIFTVGDLAMHFNTSEKIMRKALQKEGISLRSKADVLSFLAGGTVRHFPPKRKRTIKNKPN